MSDQENANNKKWFRGHGSYTLTKNTAEFVLSINNFNEIDFRCNELMYLVEIFHKKYPSSNNMFITCHNEF